MRDETGMRKPTCRRSTFYPAVKPKVTTMPSRQIPRPLALNRRGRSVSLFDARRGGIRSYARWKFTMAEVEWAGRSNKAARRIEEKEGPQGRAKYRPRRDYSDPSHFRLLPVTPYQGVERGAGRERDDGARLRVS
jgi:hypothetical protein